VPESAAATRVGLPSRSHPPRPQRQGTGSPPHRFPGDPELVRRTVKERGYTAPVLLDESGDVTGKVYGVWGRQRCTSSIGRGGWSVGPPGPGRGTAQPDAGSSRRCSTHPPLRPAGPVCEFPDADARLISYECCTLLAGRRPSPRRLRRRRRNAPPEQTRLVMDPTSAAEARERVAKWIEEARQIFGLLPE